MVADSKVIDLLKKVVSFLPTAVQCVRCNDVLQKNTVDSNMAIKVHRSGLLALRTRRKYAQNQNKRKRSDSASIDYDHAIHTCLLL